MNKFNKIRKQIKSSPRRTKTQTHSEELESQHFQLEVGLNKEEPLEEEEAQGLQPQQWEDLHFHHLYSSLNPITMIIVMHKKNHLKSIL
jgi:hypothetical protein